MIGNYKEALDESKRRDSSSAFCVLKKFFYAMTYMHIRIYTYMHISIYAYMHICIYVAFANIYITVFIEDISIYAYMHI